MSHQRVRGGLEFDPMGDNMKAVVGAIAIAMIGLGLAPPATAKAPHAVDWKWTLTNTSAGPPVIDEGKSKGDPFGVCDVRSKTEGIGGGFVEQKATATCGSRGKVITTCQYDPPSYDGECQFTRGTGRYQGLSGTATVSGHLVEGNNDKVKLRLVGSSNY